MYYVPVFGSSMREGLPVYPPLRCGFYHGRTVGGSVTWASFLSGKGWVVGKYWVCVGTGVLRGLPETNETELGARTETWLASSVNLPLNTNQ